MLPMLGEYIGYPTVDSWGVSPDREPDYSGRPLLCPAGTVSGRRLRRRHLQRADSDINRSFQPTNRGGDPIPR